MYYLTKKMAKPAFRLNFLGLVVTLVGIIFYAIGANCISASYPRPSANPVPARPLARSFLSIA